MAREFTDDDRGSTVLDHEGTELGSVTDVRDGRAHVKTDDTASESGVIDEIKSALGWDDGNDTHELRGDDVETINDTEVRLKRM
ncbi:hypothetical protein [Halococcus hamelinensis]|uniref:PRC-barrel domain-containing protein n=1 Tax=Halococcus hamelinensis 100A6 TaxID=1132509 RepID=M0M5I4_9EURY|nr:hypothetical protein [Halococcus hamelinensis]EMA40663.1 hypothetical protein C447_04056 [Halococcus hamelinensis 100A6]